MPGKERKRKVLRPEFKARVGLVAWRGLKTIHEIGQHEIGQHEIAQECGVHPGVHPGIHPPAPRLRLSGGDHRVFAAGTPLADQ